MAMVYQSVSWPPPFLSAKTRKSEEKLAVSRTKRLRVIRVAKHLVRSSSRSASEYVPVKATGVERTLRQCKTALWCCEIRCQGFRVMSFQTDLYIYIYISYNIYIYMIYDIVVKMWKCWAPPGQNHWKMVGIKSPEPRQPIAPIAWRQWHGPPGPPNPTPSYQGKWGTWSTNRCHRGKA